MSTEPLNNSNEPEIDEIEAALSNLEVTLEAGHTDKILVNIFLKTKCFHLCCSSEAEVDRQALTNCMHMIIDSCLSCPQEDITDIPELANSLRLFR